MFAILHALGMFVADLFKSRTRLEAENLFLRHQLTIALRQAPPRLRLRVSDRALLIAMTRFWPSLLGMTRLVQPETILRWHRAGFKAFWRWKSRHRAGRPKIDRGLRDLIRQVSKENPLWGAPRIHGELLKLGFEVAAALTKLSNSDPFAAVHESATGPKRTWLVAPHMSAFGGKADMTVCGNPLSRPLLGVKRTSLFATHMSAFDPKRT